MCSSCVRDHLLRIIGSVKAQISGMSASKSLKLSFERCMPCRPYGINPAAVRNCRRSFCFPGATNNEAYTFTLLLRLCSLLAENLTSNKVSTIRDLYYQDVTLFRTQNNVARALERITRMILVPRDALNVVPSPNGLIVGDLTIAMQGGDVLEVLRSNGPSLIPVASVMYVSGPRVPTFLLIVEKEAVFFHLQEQLSEGLIVTGKGFPDRATRRLVTQLTVAYPDMPVFGLFDSDPHGILIFRNYEYGSEQNVEQQERMNMIYLGVSLLEYSEGLVPLTANDIRVSMSTLQKPWINEPRYTVCKTELQRGLFMLQKGEMNLLDGNQSQRLSGYVRNKIITQAATSQAEVGSQGALPTFHRYGDVWKLSPKKRKMYRLHAAVMANTKQHRAASLESARLSLKRQYCDSIGLENKCSNEDTSFGHD